MRLIDSMRPQVCAVLRISPILMSSAEVDCVNQPYLKWTMRRGCPMFRKSTFSWRNDCGMALILCPLRQCAIGTSLTSWDSTDVNIELRTETRADRALFRSHGGRYLGSAHLQ